MAGEKSIASSVGTSTASDSAVSHKHPLSFLGTNWRSRSCKESNAVEPKPKAKRNLLRTVTNTLRLTERKIDLVTSTAPHRRKPLDRPQQVKVWRHMGGLGRRRQRSKQSGENVMDAHPGRVVSGSEDVHAEHVEEINSIAATHFPVAHSTSPLCLWAGQIATGYEKCEDMVLPGENVMDEHPGCAVSGSVHAEHVEDSIANAGIPPHLFVCGLNAGQIATGYEKCEIQVSIDMVVWIVGEDGECIRDICDITRTHIELLQPNPSDIEQSKDWIVRITGGKEEMEAGRQMVLGVMDVTKEDIEEGEQVSGSGTCAEFVEVKDKAENKLANAGHFACGLNVGQVATGGFEQVDIEVPFEKVDLFEGFAGETLTYMNDLSRARIELIEPNPSVEKWYVRISANNKLEMYVAKEMVKDVMNQTRRKSSLQQQAPQSSTTTLGLQPTPYPAYAAQLTQAHQPGYDQSLVAMMAALAAAAFRESSI